MEILQVKNLSFSYPDSQNNALNNLSFSLQSGGFYLLIGQSGCGKTTLLKLLKKEIAPFGEISGSILYKGKPVSETSFEKIGYVDQSPESQIITDKVWHELAFGLENMGLSKKTIRLRVGETASYFGIGGWYHKSTDELSGGQKQLLNLASIVAMRPEILLLDEPTAQLDPIAAASFINTIVRLNKELGITVLMSEHRLEDALPIADRVLALDEGELLCYDSPRLVCEKLKEHKLSVGFPSATRIWSALGGNGICPLTVKEGKEFLNEKFPDSSGKVNVKSKRNDETALKLKEVSFRYQRNSSDVLHELDFQVAKGEIFSIVGANGSGKSTLLRVIAGLLVPYRGKCSFFGNAQGSKKREKSPKGVVLLPQDPTTLFIKNTVEEDLYECLNVLGVNKRESQKRINNWVENLELENLLLKHPYDISGGEKQKLALAKLLITNPKILLLDEPTKGFDAYFKSKLKKILCDLKSEDITVISVTHDIEFAAAVSDRCGLLFDGSLLSVGQPNDFFSDNHFYTTAASRISRGVFENAVICEEVVSLCSKEK